MIETRILFNIHAVVLGNTQALYSLIYKPGVQIIIFLFTRANF